MEELANLADTAGAEIYGEITQRRAKPDSAFFLGQGKAESVVNQAKELNCSIILFNDELLIVGGIIYLIYLVVSLVSLYLIYKLKPSGRKLYTICFVAGLIISLMSGPIIMGPLLTVLVDLNVAIDGATLVFLYFTPIKNNFR